MTEKNEQRVEARAVAEPYYCGCQRVPCQCPDWCVKLDGEQYIRGQRDACKNIAAAMNSAFDISRTRPLDALRALDAARWRLWRDGSNPLNDSLRIQAADLYGDELDDLADATIKAMGGENG